MNKYYIRYLAVMILFGSNGIFASMIELNSYEIVLWRTLIGSLLLLLLFLLTGNRFSFLKHKKSFMMLMISGMAMGGSWMFLYEAYHQIGVSIATLCYYCGPVIVMALAPVLFKEKLSFIKVSGFIIVLIGIFLINSQVTREAASIFGIFCGLMSAVMYSMMFIFNKKCTEISGLENASLQLVFGFLTTAVYIFFKQGLNLHIPGTGILPLAILGLINTGLGCYLYFSTIGKLPVQTVAITGYLEPLSAVLLSVLFLKESLLPLQIIGAVCIIGGAILSEGIIKIPTSIQRRKEGLN